MKTIAEARIENHLNRKIRYEGEIMTNRDMVDRLLSEGFEGKMHNKVNGKTIMYAAVSKDGDLVELSKIQYDYMMQALLLAAYSQLISPQGQK